MKNPKKQKRQALEGVKVVDFGWVAAGPGSIRYLADFGATIVRIESSTNIDVTRFSPPWFNDEIGVNTGGFFNQYNSGKLGISINLKDPKGKDLAVRLIKWADILNAAFTPGTMEGLGLGYEDVKEFKPDIVYVYSSQAGQNGPHKSFAAFGSQGQGLAGISYITGYPDEEDLAPPSGPFTDYTFPHCLVPSIMAALDYRRRTGKGVFIDSSQIEVGIHHIAPVVMDYFANGRIAERNGNKLSYAAPHGVYRCKGDDRWIAVTVSDEEEWKSFCKVLGDPPWTRKPQFFGVIARKENEDELNSLIEKWTTKHSAEDVEVSMQKAGIAASVVHTIGDILEDPQLNHRGYWRRLDHPNAGQIPHISPAFSLSKSPISMRPAPMLGQHTVHVCKEILGMSESDITDLLTDGVIATG